ncbi:MAG: hypothetical protein AB7H96_22810 [Vicinamibacterales bacterium]
MTSNQEPADLGVWLRLLALLLVAWEPVAFAMVAAGATNAIGVRGTPVVLVLVARLAATALCVAAGRAVLDRRPSAPALVKGALIASAAVQIFATLTPFFPSNRLPGQAPFVAGATAIYYGAWLGYMWRARRVRDIFA